MLKVENSFSPKISSDQPKKRIDPESDVRVDFVDCLDKTMQQREEHSATHIPNYFTINLAK